MTEKAKILGLDPAAGIPGGEVILITEDAGSCRVLFGNARAHIVGASSRRITVHVPEFGHEGKTQVVLERNHTQSAPALFIGGRKLADNLHPVANPAFDPASGDLFITRSGSRGQQLPVTIFRLSQEAGIEEFSGDITNPTGIAFHNGNMFVTSRHDGTVYRINKEGDARPFAVNLGIATGLAFDRAGLLYVGDRTGTIWRVNEIGEETAWAHLEQSVSAYHLAFGADDFLYVTGPTVSSNEGITRIDPAGTPSVFSRGLGRPQGLAFDRNGNLYVAASFRGRRGIVRVAPDGSSSELVIAGMNVVGLAFGPLREMIIATVDALFSLPVGIEGLPLYTSAT